MSEEQRRKALAELLASPLDATLDPVPQPDPEPRPDQPRRKPHQTFPVLALVIGAAVVLAGFAIGRGGDEPTAIATTTPPTTAADAEADAASGDGLDAFPPGFNPVDDLVAIQPQRAVQLGEETHVTLAVVYRRGFDPELSAPYSGGDWELILEDGRRIPSAGQVSQPWMPGVITVVFPTDDYTTNDLVAMEASSRWFTRYPEVVQELEAVGLPYLSEESQGFDLGEGVQLNVERVELSDEGGELAWSLDGDPDAAAIASAIVELRIGFNDFTPEVMIPVGTSSSFFVFPEAMATSGTVDLTRPTLDETADLFSITVIWTLTLTTSEPAEVLVPLTDLVTS